MTMNRLGFGIALVLVAAAASRSPASEPRFVADDRRIGDAIAASPKDFIAGVVEVVKRCEQATETGCLDRVRIVEIVAARTENGSGRSVGETFLLMSAKSAPQGEPTPAPRLLVLAVPVDPTRSSASYGATVLGEAPTEGDVTAFSSTVDAVIDQQGV